MQITSTIIQLYRTKTIYKVEKKQPKVKKDKKRDTKSFYKKS